MIKPATLALALARLLLLATFVACNVSFYLWVAILAENDDDDGDERLRLTQYLGARVGGLALATAFMYAVWIVVRDRDGPWRDRGGAIYQPVYYTNWHAS